MSTPTRERIIDAAVVLFGERGFKGTSVAEIEAAAGLSPGAGGLYHHFRSKQAVLEAGLERHLTRLEALRDIRRIIGDVGDVHVELTIMARYVLAELDSEAELFRILVSEARQRPEILAETVNQLITSTFTDFADWLRNRGEHELTDQQAQAIASVSLGSLLSSRLMTTVLAIPALPVGDKDFVATWVDSVRWLMEHPPELEER